MQIFDTNAPTMDRYVRKSQKNIDYIRNINKKRNESGEDLLTNKTSKYLFRKSKVDELVDDFYSNILDWCGNNIYYSSVSTLKRYNYNTTKSESISTLNSVCINALRVNPQNTDICMGNSNGTIVFHNIETERQQTFNQHKSRVGIVEWVGNNVLCSGARDRNIKIMDLRAKGEFLSVTKHTQEICGLKCNCDGLLLASGGNDNKLMIHDLRFLETPLKIFTEHKAAVKAIAWSPKNRNLLVSGGGTADKSIKMWDIGKIHKFTSKNVIFKNDNINFDEYDSSDTNSIYSESEFIDDDILYNFEFNYDSIFKFKTNSSRKSYDKMEAIRIQNSIIRNQSGMSQMIGNELYLENISNDKKLYNEECLIKSTHGGSQICNLYWTNNEEIISTTGYSNHDIRIYNENLKLKKKMYGHRSRVIHFAISENENCFVTASTNSEFYFWKLDKFINDKTHRL